jgi:hypothetical protein
VALAGVLAAIALGITATAVMALRESRARRLADQNAQHALASADQAEAARRTARREAYQARLAAATAAMGRQDVGEAARQLAAAPDELRGWEWRYLQGWLDQSIAAVSGLPERLSVAFCPPGRRLAAADGPGYRLRDARDGTTLAVRTTGRTCHQVFTFATRSGMRFVLDQSSENTLSFSLADEDGRALGRITRSSPWNHPFDLVMAMSPDGRRLAFQSVPYSRVPLIEVFDTATGQMTATCGEPLTNRLQGLDFSPDGTRIAAARSEDPRVLIFDADSGRSVAELAGHTDSLRAVAYSPDGGRLASCGDDQTIRVWDTATGQVLHTLHGHAGDVVCVAFSPDGRRLASGGNDGTVRFWSAEAGEALLVLHGHTAAVNRVAFSDDGRTTARMGTGSPRGRGTGRSGSGMPPAAARPTFSRVTATRSAPWRLHRTERAWLPGPRTGRSASGTPRPARSSSPG